MDKRTVSSAHTRIDGLEKEIVAIKTEMDIQFKDCLLYTSPSPRDGLLSRMPSSA